MKIPIKIVWPLALIALSAQSQAQTPSLEIPEGQAVFDQEGVVAFPAAFFRTYQVQTALDMVNRIPGFTLDDGGAKRGFGGAAGNVLINGRRPSTKQDVPSAILSRISSGLVERIELLRVRVREIDLQGHASVVNVILREDAPAVVRWEAYVRENLDHGTSPGGSISLSHWLGEIDYNVGFDAYLSVFGNPGEIRTFDSAGNLTGIRLDDEYGDGPDSNAYLNASTWIGETFAQFNSRAGIENRDILLTSTRIPLAPGEELRQEVISTYRRNKKRELGLDAERLLHPDLLGKGILLYSLVDGEPSLSQQDLDAVGVQTRFQLQDEETTSEEFIARLEFDWAGLENHAVQVDLERAYNVLDNSQIFTDDAGAGPVIVDIPNANVRVEEVRWNLQAQDTWSLGRFDLEYGLGLERSTLSQTGDANQERSFSFLKPRAVLTYTHRRERLSRVGFEREVSQLDFSDFVSAAVFEDDDVSLGNPNLRPDSTWMAEASHEWRFGEVGAVKISVFHHWIQDVLDLLPLSPTFEATGNIGDGRRWGLLLETALPLDWLGLPRARLDIRTRWQDSTVVDPVTGEDRMLSAAGGFRGSVIVPAGNQYNYDIAFRQDLQAERVSWGLGIVERSRRVLYKANELDTYDEGYDLNAFVETTRWLGLKIGLEGQNLRNFVVERERIVYTGERALSPVRRIERREGDNGIRILLRVSGSF